MSEEGPNPAKSSPAASHEWLGTRFSEVNNSKDIALIASMSLYKVNHNPSTVAVVYKIVINIVDSFTRQDWGTLYSMVKILLNKVLGQRRKTLACSSFMVIDTRAYQRYHDSLHV